MVLPEGRPAPEPQRSRAPRLAGIGLAIVALFAGILALAQATSPQQDVAIDPTQSTITIPDPLSSPTTTLPETSFSISDIATGERFFWIKSPPSGRFWPIELLSHGGQVYLFGSEQMSPSGVGGLGLSAWVSADGVGWEPLGEVADADYEVTSVVSTGPGLVALGSRIVDGEPVIWTSANGIGWTRTDLPTGEQLAGTRYRLEDAVLFEGHLRVVGARVLDLAMDVLLALPTRLVGTDLGSVQVGFEIGGVNESATAHIYGPIGLHAFSTDLAELGLDPAFETLLVNLNPPPRQYLWSLSQGSGWTSSELTVSPVAKLWVSPEGLLIAYGSAGAGLSISTTEDGINWLTHAHSSHERRLEIEADTPWRGSLIGGGIGGDLYETTNGIVWERMGTGELLPEEIRWDLGPIGAGTAGLVTIAGVLEAGASEQIDPVTVGLGGADLTLDLAPGRLRVEKPGYEPLEVPLWAPGAETPYTIDFHESTVTFIDPESGVELITVGFSTLEEAMAQALSAGVITERALLFTSDGRSWGAQDLTNVVVAENEIDDVALLHDRVLLLTRERGREGSVPPRVTIFVGQIDP